MSTIIVGTTPLASRAERLERELAATRQVQELLQSFREALDEFPALREDMAAELLAMVKDDREARQQRPDAKMSFVVPGTSQTPEFVNGTNRERINAYLRSRNNQPATVDEIHEATGIPEASIRHAFSTRYPDEYIVVEVESSRLKHWRMRAEGELNETVFSQS